MNLNNINGIINRIISKKIYFYYKDTLYYYKFPDIDIKLQADLLYDETFEQLKFDDIILEENLDYYLQEYEIVNFSLKDHLKRLNKKLDDLKIELFQNFFLTSKRKAVENKIKNLRRNIEEAEIQNYSLAKLTIENICANIQNDFLLLNGIFSSNHKLVFNSKDLTDVDQFLFNALSQEINKKFLKSSDYRLVARSSNWKALWNIKKHHIFDGSVASWSEEQKTMVGISQMYDSVYQHPDCPEDEIIEHDDALDGWSTYHSRKIKEEKKKNGVSSKLEKHKNAQEVFVVANSQQDVEDIIGMNDSEGLGRMQSKINFVIDKQKKSEKVLEIEIPQVRSDLQKTLNEQRKNQRK